MTAEYKIRMASLEDDFQALGGADKLPSDYATKAEYYKALLLNGSSVEQIAKRSGVCLETIRKMLSRQGIKISTKRPPEQIAQWKREYRSGMKPVDIAKIHGVSPSTVYRHVL